jgi:hypothetical protein
VVSVIWVFLGADDGLNVGGEKGLEEEGVLEGWEVEEGEN